MKNTRRKHVRGFWDIIKGLFLHLPCAFMGMFRERQRGWLKIKLENFFKNENYIYMMSNNFRHAGEKKTLFYSLHMQYCVFLYND